MGYQDQNDGTLVLLTLAGESKAFETLVVRHQRAVVLAAYSVLRNYHLAEDCAQDAFVASWIKLDKLNNPEKFGAWVQKTSHNYALNVVTRYRKQLSLDEYSECTELCDDGDGPDEILISSEEKEELRLSLESLPEKTRKVVYLHYFEDLGISEIAERLSISEGTVKWQLHEGRRRIRKELIAVDENTNDTMLQKVMKKVEELKQYRLQSKKTGFEKAYREVLKEIESLSETANKYHAMADVLAMGCWWVPGENNKKLLERIRDAAEKGKNDEVMSFVVNRELDEYWGDEWIRRAREVYIPRFEGTEFKFTLGSLWFSLGNMYTHNSIEENEDKKAEAAAAYDKAMEILGPTSPYYVSAKAVKEILDSITSNEFKEDLRRRHITMYGNIFKVVGGEPRFWERTAYAGFGELYSIDFESDDILENAFRCDSHMTIAGLKVGEKVTASDGKVLRFEDNNADVTTPAGEFTGCEVWSSKDNYRIYRTYIKRGVGIVRQESRYDGVVETRNLVSYKIIGGEGMLPLCEGNRWEYKANFNPEALDNSCAYEVSSYDGERACISRISHNRRYKYDENSWLEMISKVRAEYNKHGKDRQILNDVRADMKRAIELAETPLQKVHSKYASSVVNRILDTDTNFSPDADADGLWNFFRRDVLYKEDGTTRSISNFRWNFEWKRGPDCESGYGIYSNFIYDILQETTGCLWSDSWAVGYSSEETSKRNPDVKNSIICEDGGSVTCAAGTFENCLKMTVISRGFHEGLEYRNGKRVYYFAQGIGLVRLEVYRDKTEYLTVYELVKYTGTGEGYMPFEDGLERRYEANKMADGYFAAAEYCYVADDEGRIVVFTDQTGIRRKICDITEYGTIHGDQLEQELADAWKSSEANTEGAYNTLKLLCHSLSKSFHGYYDPVTRARRFEYNLRQVRALTTYGSIPPAMIGYYSRISLWAAVAFIGGGLKEEGYKWLDESIDLIEQWEKFNDGDKLDVGDPSIFMGIKYIKGEGLVEMPDGKLRDIDR